MSGPRTTMVLITVVHGVWASLFAFVTPIFEAPDENAHVENVCHVLQTGGMPDSAPVVYAADGHGVFEGHRPPLYYLVCAGVAAVLRLNPCDTLQLQRRTETGEAAADDGNIDLDILPQWRRVLGDVC